MASPVVTTGRIPFVVAGERYETWYKVVGDLSDRTVTPVIALHGGPGFSHDYLSPLEDIYTATSIPIIFYDQLGNANSTHLPHKPSEFWTIDLFVDELVNILHHFGIQNRYDLLGHSWGGWLALEFLVRRRQETAGLQHLIISNSSSSVELRNKAHNLLWKGFPDIKPEDRNTAQARERFYKRHVCKIDPFPKDFIKSLDYNFAETADTTVSDAM